MKTNTSASKTMTIQILFTKFKTIVIML